METKKVRPVALIQCFAGFLLLEGFRSVLLPAFPNLSFHLLVIFRAGELTLVIFLIRFYMLTETFGLKIGKSRKALIRGVFWFLVSLVGWFWLREIGIFEFLDERMERSTGSIGSQWEVCFLLVGYLLSSILEEILFRGFLFGYLRQWGLFFSVVVSSIVFTLFHYPHMGFIHLAGGVAFAIVYERDKSLLSPISIHATGNLLILYL